MFGVSSSPFLLNATVNHHIEQYRTEDPDFVEAFNRAIYVDDLNTGGNDDTSVYNLYRKARLRLAEGGFNLRKFVTNSPELRKTIEHEQNGLHHGKPESVRQGDEQAIEVIDEEDETYSNTMLGTFNESSNEEHKVLGVTWNFIEDKLIFDLGRTSH
jgi:hypothetical protein